MFTRFEEYAAASMLGETDSPPRLDGKLLFTNRWERDVFGLALSLSKAGCFEWEDFRQSLISSIAQWENASTASTASTASAASAESAESARAGAGSGVCAGQPRWDYYERFLEALLNVVESKAVLSREELAKIMIARRPSTGSATCV